MQRGSDLTHCEVTTNSEIESPIVVKVPGNDQVGKYTVRQENHSASKCAISITEQDDGLYLILACYG